MSTLDSCHSIYLSPSAFLSTYPRPPSPPISLSPHKESKNCKTDVSLKRKTINIFK